MLSLVQILFFIFDVIWYLVLIQVILSWLISFQVLSLRQPIVAQIWHGLERLFEPIYRPIRRILPDLGGLDLSPLVLLLAIYALRVVIANNIGLFL